ncbi:MAG: Na(+)-translocating NADH-quinone reductase subunit A [Vicinamibacterales bacterium]
MTHQIRRGLRVPVTGEPEQRLGGRRDVSHVALLADDSVGLKPTLHVAPGDTVARGQLLFEDKKRPGVRYTAPGAGTVVAVHRGERRAFRSLVLRLSDDERAGRGAQVSFAAHTGRHPSALDADGVRDLLVESGLWTALRARPFSRVADPATRPRSIFVTAVDTEPLAPSMAVVLGDRAADFETGLAALTRLTDGPVFVCTDAEAPPEVPGLDRVRHERFAGPHPSGTVGLHIHRLDPVGRGRLVWHLGLQEVLAIGRLFATGTLDPWRTVSLAGPAVRTPRLVETRLGASVDELVKGELSGAPHGAPDGEQGSTSRVRVLSGSILSGRVAAGEVTGYLGRYHQQVAALPEDRDRTLLGWAMPGFDRFSSIGAFASRLLPSRALPLTTTTHGSPRAIVPIGMYERVMPFDIQPTFLLKALLTDDVERAEALGCLELDEEDLALCTFVCPGKHTYGPYLRQVLTRLEVEG